MPSTYAQNVGPDYPVPRVTPREGVPVAPYGGTMDEAVTPTPDTPHVPGPIVAIHVLAAVGVLFWLSMIVAAVTGGTGNPAGVIGLGVVLGGAHVAISWLTHRHSRLVYAAMGFILVCDSALAILVDPRAVLLVLFTIVLLLLTRAPSARRWFARPG
jgi:hypothetical protein